MSAVDAAPTPLSKVDSAVQGLSSSPPKDDTKAEPKRRASSSVPGVYNILDLGMSAPQLLFTISISGDELERPNKADLVQQKRME